MIYVVLQADAVLKSDLYIRLRQSFHYRNPLLLVCSVGLFPLPAIHLYLYLFLLTNTSYKCSQKNSFIFCIDLGEISSSKRL